MDPTSTLIGLGEISLALAGFAAIVLVLDSRNSQLDPQTLATMRIMISNAVGSAFNCLVAIAILALSESPSLAWRLSSGWVFVGTVGVSAVNFFLIIRHLDGPAPRHAMLWWFFAIASVGIHASNTIGLFGGPSFGLFFLGSVVLLSQAGSQFLFMVSTHLGRSAV